MSAEVGRPVIGREWSVSWRSGEGWLATRIVTDAEARVGASGEVAAGTHAELATAVREHDRLAEDLTR